MFCIHNLHTFKLQVIKLLVTKLLCLLISVNNAISFSNEISNQDEIIEKYKLWKKVIKHSKKSNDVFDFYLNNTHWPLFKESVKVAEQHIKKSKDLNDDKLLKWFKKNPPLTKDGIEAYIECLQNKDRKLAYKFIQQTWIYQNLDTNYLEQFRNKYQKYLTNLEDAQKVKLLASQNNIDQLKAMQDIVTQENILNFINEYLNNTVKIDENLLNDSSQRYRYLENLISNEKYEEAAKIFVLTNEGENKISLKNKFYEKRKQVAYSMIRAGKPQLAYTVAEKCVLSGNNEKASRLQFLMGFVAFRFMNKPDLAKKHFENAFYSSKEVVRLSKNAFWLAEVCLSQHDPVAAINWYKKGSEYFSTFYGYLSEMRLNQLSEQYSSITTNKTASDKFIAGKSGPDKSGTDKPGSDKSVPIELEKTFYNRELVQVLIATKNVESDSQFRQYLYDQLISEIDDPYEELLLIKLAESNDETSIVIGKLAKKQHYFINDANYKELNGDDRTPVLNINSNSCFISVVHSVIRQESAFKETAKSHAGAIGLMQLMPNTAKDEAKIMNIKIKDEDDLYDKYNNLLLGSNLLNRLMQKYDNNLVDVLYAYNAGPKNLAKFKKSISNLNNLTVLETIELIPIHETRVYVKSVLRNLFYYDQQFDCNYKNKVIDTILKF